MPKDALNARTMNVKGTFLPRDVYFHNHQMITLVSHYHPFSETLPILHFIFPQILSQTEANSRFKERATLELAG